MATPRPSNKNNTSQWPIVEVIWRDAEEVGEVGWNELKAQMKCAKTPCPLMRSVGYCVYQNNDHVALLSTIGVKEASTLEKIPKVFIDSITTLLPCQTEPIKKGLNNG